MLGQGQHAGVVGRAEQHAESSHFEAQTQRREQTENGTSL